MTTNRSRGDVWDAVIHLLNKAIQIEYAFIVNYPRLIEHLVNFDGIKDEQLSKNLEYLGKASTRHLGLIEQIIVALGGRPVWRINTIDRMTHVEDVLNTQIDREKKALSLYQEVRDVARRNGGKRRKRGFLDKLFKKEDELWTMQVDTAINVLDSIIGEEHHHIRLVQDMVRTLNRLLSKRETELDLSKRPVPLLTK